jgi:hypothetical protein
MSEYLVEAYCSSAGPSDAPPPRDIAEAADELSRVGRPVRLVRTVLVPEDETCFYLFEAASGEAVVEAAARSGLRYERVVEAHSAWTVPGDITSTQGSK